MESFAASQPESSWDDFFAYAEEIFAHYQNIITSAIPVAIEIASWAAARFSDFLEFFEQSSSPVCLANSGSFPNHPDLSAFDNLVGPLVFEARRRHGPRLPKHEHLQIAGSEHAIPARRGGQSPCTAPDSETCQFRTFVKRYYKTVLL